ncbi:hypothetical protein D3C83_84830 [compost metagenome]
MCGPVRVNFSGRLARLLARAQAIGRFSVPAPTGPSTTPGGRLRKRMPAPFEYSSHSENAMSPRMPDIGRVKYSIMPFVSG